MTTKRKTSKKTRATKKAASHKRPAARKPAKTGSAEAVASPDAGKNSAEFVIFLDDPDPVTNAGAGRTAIDSDSADLLQNISTSTEGTQQLLLLPAVCCSQDVVAVHRQLLALTQNGQDLTIDARDVEEVDTAYLQLLCAFALDTAKNRVEVRWQCGDGPFSSAIEHLGLSEQFQCI